MLKELRQDIDTVLARDPAARSRLEVLLCYPGVHALTLHRVAHWLWRRHWYTLARFISHLSRMLTGIEIHPGAQIGRGVFIDHGLGVVIGETAQVGDNCTIYQGVTLGGTSLTKGAKRHPTLEEGVIVAAGAKVLGGFTVGAGARVGSNSVLLRAVPPGATAVGMPAKILEPKPERQPEGVSDHPAPSATHQAFSAYGLSAQDEDPMARAMHQLIDHIAQQDEVIEQLRLQVNRLSQMQLVDNRCEPLDKTGLSKLID